jgi:hypothetical protein
LAAKTLFVEDFLFFQEKNKFLNFFLVCFYIKNKFKKIKKIILNAISTDLLIFKEINKNTSGGLVN